MPAEYDTIERPTIRLCGRLLEGRTRTVAVQGGVTGAPVAAQVAESFIPPTTTELEVRVRKSAKPEGAGNVVWSTMRKRSLVTFPPVLFTKRRTERYRAESGVVGWIRGEIAAHGFGGFEEATVASRRFIAKVPLRLIWARKILGTGRAETLASTR